MTSTILTPTAEQVEQARVILLPELMERLIDGVRRTEIREKRAKRNGQHRRTRWPAGMQPRNERSDIDWPSRRREW